MPGPADYIAGGAPGILRAMENKGAALKDIGGAIGYGATSLGVGIFRMAQKAKEEKEVAEIDDAFKGSAVTGDLKAVAMTAAGLKPTTLRGRQHLKDKVDGLRTLSRDLLNERVATARIGEDENQRAADRMESEAFEWGMQNPGATVLPEKYRAYGETIGKGQDQRRQIDEGEGKARKVKDDEEMNAAVAAVLRGRDYSALDEKEIASLPPKIQMRILEARASGARGDASGALARERFEFEKKSREERDAVSKERFEAQRDRWAAQDERAAADFDAGRIDKAIATKSKQIDDTQTQIRENTVTTNDISGQPIVTIKDPAKDKALRERLATLEGERDEWAKRQTEAPAKGLLGRGAAQAYSYKTVEEWTAAAKAVPAEQREAFKAAYLKWKSQQGK